MKNICVLLLLCLMVAGCDNGPTTLSEWDTRCIDGVKYLFADRGITVVFNADSTVKTCKE